MMYGHISLSVCVCAHVSDDALGARERVWVRFFGYEAIGDGDLASVGAKKPKCGVSARAGYVRNFWVITQNPLFISLKYLIFMRSLV